MSGVRQKPVSRIESGSGGTKLETIFDLSRALELKTTVTERSKGTSDGAMDIILTRAASAASDNGVLLP